MCARIALLGARGLTAAHRALDVAVLAQDLRPVHARRDLRDQLRLQHLEDPAGEGEQQLVAGGLGEDLMEALVGVVERRRARLVLGGLVDRRLQRGRGLLGRRWPPPGRPAGTSRNMRASSSSPSETVSVASIIEIDSLTLRLMPSLGVRATKMPPARPRPTRIRCEEASSRRPSRSVGRLDAELGRELLLGADPVARLQALALEVAADLERDLMARIDARGGEARLGSSEADIDRPILRQRKDKIISSRASRAPRRALVWFTDYPVLIQPTRCLPHQGPQ